MTAMGMISRSAMVWMALIVSCLGLGGFMIWAATAPLAEGVVAQGKVAVENQKKVVQHLEGGIIQEILVKEGDVVNRNDPLLILADVAITAGRDQVEQDLANARAAVIRLEALLNGQSSLDFPPFDDLSLEGPIVDGIVNRQISLFKQQRRTLVADVEVLKSRRESLLEKADSEQVQIDNTQEAALIVEADLKRSRELLDMRMVNIREVTALELELTKLNAELARLTTNQQSARSEANSLEDEIKQIRERFLETVNNDLVKTRTQMLSFEENRIAAEDILSRTVIMAPQAGEILNMRFSTPGGVVRPGEEILEIVPTQSDIIALVQISPSDRDAVFEQLNVDARLSGLNSWRSPPLKGKIKGISADLKTTDDGKYSFYEARVSISAESLKKLDAKPLPGMPVEAFVYSGQTRTFLDYLAEPISTTFRRGARE